MRLSQATLILLADAGDYDAAMALLGIHKGAKIGTYKGAICVWGLY